LKFRAVVEEGNNNGREFFYGVDKAGVSIASKDFESVYKLDNSNIF